MFCIAAFIVLVIISIFSAKYRAMAKSAWGCVGRRITFRPCDTKFKDELKSRLLARVALKKPQYLKLANFGIELAAFLIVVLTVWSLYVVVKSGLNIYVYGTCNPSNAASCSIGAEACSIETVKPSFITSVKTLQVHTWIADEFTGFAETVTEIPSRMREWKAEDYLPTNATYEKQFDAAKPTVLEIIDPGCQVCKQLYTNQKTANLADRYNVTYLAYPIKDPRMPNGYKFNGSLKVTQYLEAMKLQPLKGAKTPADWQILDRIFTKNNERGFSYQTVINGLLSVEQTEVLLKEWLAEIGYSDAEIQSISEIAQSKKVQDSIDLNRKIVDEKVNTVTIPTIIFDGKRHNGALDVDELR